MRKHLCWWDKFLFEYNGVSCIPNNIWSKPDEIFSTDSCLASCGACSSTHFFHVELPHFIIDEGRYINQFELYAILIATREWAPSFANRNILIYYDNQTSVQVLRTGKVDCTFMQKCLREIRFHSAKFNFRLRPVHLPGDQNRISDSLSRWIFLKVTKGLDLTETIISNFKIADYW